MRAELYRCLMIATQHYPAVIAFPFYLPKQQPQHGVYAFDSLCLVFRLAAMTAFVRCLHMDVNEVVIFKCSGAGKRLAHVICICRTVGAFYLYRIQPSGNGYAFYEINGRYNSTRQSCFLTEQRQSRLYPGRPKPYGIRGVFPFGLPAKVERVRLQQLIATLSQLSENGRRRQILAYLSSDYIMRTGKIAKLRTVILEELFMK